jgi:predicted nucleic acid-binding protein
MNEGAVVDASVAVKWVVAESFAAQAQALFNDTLAAHYPIMAPPHFLGEVTNALYQRTRRTGDLALDEAEARSAVASLLALPVDLRSPPSFYKAAFDFARAYRLASIYDSLYITLAELLDVECWTADRRLLNAVGAAVPRVRWIGDYSPGS